MSAGEQHNPRAEGTSATVPCHWCPCLAWLATALGLIGLLTFFLSPNAPRALIATTWVLALAAIILGALAAYKGPRVRARAISAVVIGTCDLALLLYLGSKLLG